MDTLIGRIEATPGNRDESVDSIRHLMVGYEQRHDLRAVGGLASIFGPSRNAG